VTRALPLLFLLGCQSQPTSNELDRRLQRMVDQDRCAADEPTAYFRNGTCNQPPPSGVRSFRAAKEGPRETGRDARGEPLKRIPVRVDRALLERGRERFELVCATCHGLLGNGDSEVAENMELRRPPAVFDPRVRELPDGQLFRVISDGYGLMPSYASHLSVEQRWAVVAYVRALALSQDVSLASLSARERQEAARWLR
jgi:mono/diheme cytochrome c family protein